MLGIRRFKDIAIDLYQGDITQFTCDAMGNAANEQLAGGGGVDGAIHRAGGSSIMKACKEIGSCATGEAVVTTAGNLPASYVIHGVGPKWGKHNGKESDLLESVWTKIMSKAAEIGVRHVAIPSISTGVYGYPLEKAAPIAMNAIRNFIEANNTISPKRITIVLFNDEHHEAYQSNLYATFPE
ncbi:MAG: hypothetical protein CMP10_04870 [Zetaproteobacteria bacterium]|nr:hypothetical protein [Pseudobdellovibrionaceae bacterium]|tara:strand:+ start:680 stop:1228 length:549 start_codon:yes stop_codon:yes gene_type:complete